MSTINAINALRKARTEQIGQIGVQDACAQKPGTKTPLNLFIREEGEHENNKAVNCAREQMEHVRVNHVSKQMGKGGRVGQTLRPAQAEIKVEYVPLLIAFCTFEEAKQPELAHGGR